MRTRPYVVFLLVAMALLMAQQLGAGTYPLTKFYAIRQDLWLLAAMMGIAMVAMPSEGKPAPGMRPLALSPWLVAVLLVAACLAGHWLVLQGHDTSRDEQMAVFDARIFATGRLVAALPPLWRDHADALNTEFLFAAPHRLAWVSGYLPMNAAFRALVGLTGLPELAGPLWTALGALALAGCIHRLWPAKPEMVAVGLLLYALSGQVLFAGMTAYAMPAHLALDLVWLWLFLGHRRRLDVAALAVGFIATGLHQPAFHPLFAAPFVLVALYRREWARVALYGLGYAAIGLFWLRWPGLVYGWIAADPLAAQPAGVDFVSRTVATISHNGWWALPIMVANLARFVAWNHLCLVPLALIGLAQRRRDPMVMALAAGLLLTLAMVTIVLPYQGHGFGYRYLHGLIGNAILLALHGWAALSAQWPRWRALMWRGSLAMALVVIPLQAVFAHAFYGAWAVPSGKIAALDADYAVIGATSAPFASDLVSNRPFLDRKPVRLIEQAIDPALIGPLCAPHPHVVFVGDSLLQADRAYFGQSRSAPPSTRPALLHAMAQAGCRVNVLP